MKKSFSRNILSAAALSAAVLALLPSCQDEEFGYTAADVRQEVYNRNFKEIFGDVDPDHNWSMAQNVKVNINVPGARGYQVRVLTEAPTNRKSIILYDGFMTSDMLTINVDVIRGKSDVYVEIMDKDLRVRLVDGYYSINESGIVEVGSLSTRAGGMAPSTKAYTTTIKRWSRYWDDATEVPSDQWYNYDFGFKNNQELRFEYIAPGDRWSFNCGSYNKNGENKPSSVTLDDNTGHSTTKTVDHHVYAAEGTIVCNNVNIPQDWATLFVLLTNWNSGENNKVKVNIKVTKPGQNQGDDVIVAKAENYVVQNTVANADLTNNTINYDVVKIVFENKESFWTGQKLEIEIIENTHLICGGFFIESFKYDKPSYDENIDGWVTYRDVRGGAVDLWLDNNHLELFDGDTKRCYGNNVFKYRTFDTRKMVYQVGDKYNKKTLTAGDAQLGKSFVAEGHIGPFYEIYGDVKIGSEEIKYADMFPLYGLYKSTTTGEWKGSPFREGDNHIDPFFSDGSHHAATEYEMQKDAQIVTIGKINSGEVQYDGSVSIKMVGMGTNWGNDVGYFYYPKSEENNLMRSLPNGEKALDFNKIPKIVIKHDMQGQIDGQKIENLTSGNDVGDYGRVWLKDYAQAIDVSYAMGLSGADLSSLLNSSKFSNYHSNQFNVKTVIDAIKDDASKKQKAANAKFKAPIFQLPYYGWQKNEDDRYVPTGTATYEWPKDYVIGFFGIRTDDMVAAELSRIYTTSASVERNYFNDIPRGSSFSYKGKNYIGLEDEWDYDNNDVLFEIQGVQSVDPDLTPEDDHVTTKTTQNWIVACEDLGGVWDYDFNDLVWAVSKEVNTTTNISWDGTQTTSGTTDIYFQALAAGGTLKAVVEYNTSIALNPEDKSNWDDNAWIEIGEIHQLVKQDENAQTAEEGAQLNVTPNTAVTTYGKRIKLGSTIPTNSSDINMASILSHFRIKVYDKNNESKYTLVQNQIKNAADEGHTGNEHNYTASATNVPQFILLPGGWDWPAEGVCITKVYDMKSWVENQGNTSWLNTWNDNKTENSQYYIVNPLK